MKSVGGLAKTSHSHCSDRGRMKIWKHTLAFLFHHHLHRGVFSLTLSRIYFSSLRPETASLTWNKVLQH